ncbi:MAG: carboxypeptidase-like regulatory domain-containing protein [Candidatus Acidiferrales bacterium]
MKQGRLRVLGALVLAAICVSSGANRSAAQAKSGSGNLAGVVRDTAGTPQMGASVEVIPEATGILSTVDLLTNTQGIFRGERLAPGFYTVRVTLAGFLPSLEKHVRITANLTTVVRIQMESMFTSLEQLRRQPSSVNIETDDWKWVLRSASVTRPVLQWINEDNADPADARADSRGSQPHMQLEFTEGARRPGSVSNLASSPATAFAFQQKLGGTSRLVVAGQMSHEDEASAGGIATIWLPTGSLGAGPHTALVMREARLGPAGPTFRGVRIDQGGTVALGDRMALRYGGEYVLVGLGTAASSMRPRLELDTRISEMWRAALIYASQPGAPDALEPGEGEQGSLTAALNELDAFPALLWRGGHPALQGGTHEELAAERKLGTKGKLQIAAFHDDNSHVAVFGRGNNLPAADYFQDYFSNGFAYDGGSSSSWGGRIALRQKLDEDLELTTVYSFAGALVPREAAEDVLRDALRTAARHSLGANISARVPHLGTKVNAGYKWINGVTVSRLDGYGESLFQLEPYMHVGVRQALPKFGPGRWEAIADCDNLLAQGYVTLNSRDGHTVLVPAFRSFRGGLSLQF